ncbi:hypothetical protein GGX14DRAFT_432292 [Mycena pura]|uniref:Zn(2)-C6 fungal-type domain-containing protein n=1 Tax=Mycena pura TaxID=153505 RepID=A0AAD6YHW2_9AGAR|nr:hypothetical protein GGX14DRAFT_432292 [Mycena pura]
MLCLSRSSNTHLSSRIGDAILRYTATSDPRQSQSPASPSSSHPTPVQRVKACTNCRCDGARPICNQCRRRPPRTQEICEYPRQEGHESLRTIDVLWARIEELENLAAPDPSRVYLNQPYPSRRQAEVIDLAGLSLTSERATPIQMLEPPTQIIATLVDIFLARFVNSGLFFFEPANFRQSVLFPLPLGHPDRPSPALLGAVYLWGSLLSQGHISPNTPYTPRAFLAFVVQHIPHDLSNATSERLLLDTLQAEILLSFYYLYAALPVQGRARAAAAASIALGAGLHNFRPRASQQVQAPCPPFAVAGPLLQPALSFSDETLRVDAFWAVVIINNYWVGAEGSPSAVPYGIAIDTPWSASSQVRLFRLGGVASANRLVRSDNYEVPKRQRLTFVLCDTPGESLNPP